LMKTQCPGCKAKFNVSDQSIGKKAKCPKCAQPFTIEPLVETSSQASVKKVEPPAPPPTPVAMPAKTVVPTKVAEKPVKEKATFKKLSKTLYVYCWMVAQVIAGALGLAAVVLASRKAPNTTLLAVLAAGDIFLVCSLAIELALFYKMWSPIQDSDASTAPAKAVGFLFIPVFNIYWALSMITAFAEDYNDFIRRRSIAAKKLSIILAFVFAVMFILYVTVVTTPFVGVLAFVRYVSKAFIFYRSLSWILFSFAIAAGIGHFITYILFATKTCDAVNSLQDSPAKA
jgi:predicted Zn finger-like uncharacterized protein